MNEINLEDIEMLEGLRLRQLRGIPLFIAYMYMYMCVCVCVVMCV